MMKGWDGSSDLLRYFMLLGGTGALAVIALACGHYLKEAKSPRVLMMLGLAAVTINFSILGAFVFSVSPMMGAIDYPTYVSWSVNDVTTAILCTSGALLVLLPVMLLGFKTLVRSQAGALTLLFLLGNGLLLIPSRDSLTVAVTALIAAGILFYALAVRMSDNPQLKTLEGFLAQILLYSPIAIMLGRSVWLYAPDATLLASASLIAFAALRQISLVFPPLHLLRMLAELMSVGTAFLAAFSVSHAMDTAMAPEALVVFVGTALATTLVYEISCRSGAVQTLFRTLAGLTAVCGLLINIFFVDGVMGTVIAMLSGIALMVIGLQQKQRLMLIAGVFITSVGLVEQIVHLSVAFDFGYWLSTALIGLIAIVVASLMESKGSRVKHRLLNFRTQIAEWEY
jgi:hypothetical protein